MSSARAHSNDYESTLLSQGWLAACVREELSPDAPALAELTWRAARVPGTAAAVLQDAGLWQPGEAHDFDAEDWWFRTNFDAKRALTGEEVVLHLEGIATVAEVYLNGDLILASNSMFAAHAIDVGERLRGKNALMIRCRALGPMLRARRRPRARWRTQLVADGNLRFFRTMLLGRAPGLSAGPAAVGPWRPVRLERRRRLAIDRLTLRPRLHEDDGVLSIHADLRPLDGSPPSSVEVELEGASGTHRAVLSLTAAEGPAACVSVWGELTIPGVRRWWPHTHGDPVLHDVRLLVRKDGQPIVVQAGRVGFRELEFGDSADHDVEENGLDLHINGARVFARGAVWTPADPVGLAPSEADLRKALTHVQAAGMNMLRLPGTGAYESRAFHELCDELGILVWQDLMFANLDYPFVEEDFGAEVRREVAGVLDLVAGRPSLTVLCGNSEIEQQVAMLGLDPSLGRGPFFGEILPEQIRASDVDAAYVPSAPCGGALPFRPERGIANYYGVGGYRRPLDDVRRAAVLFAAECLAFSNVPDDTAIERILPDTPARLVVHHPAWKAGVPRDVGVGWDFEDVRDHYLEALFQLDAAELRRVDHQRYIDLSRAVTGEAMAEVFGEWRRDGSPCGGALVLWLRDQAPGAGWGVIDDGGAPKVAYHHLRRALAPVSVWTTDEGLGGVGVHVANDRATPLAAQLRIALYRDLEHCTAEVTADMELRPHESSTHDLEALLGRFTDVSWAYRFGPPAQNAIVVSLESGDAGERQLISQAVRFPAGRPLSLETSDRIGLEAIACPGEDDSACLKLTSRRLAWGVRMQLPGFFADDDAFSIEPGHARVVTAKACTPHSSFTGGSVTALNLQGKALVEVATEMTSEAIT